MLRAVLFFFLAYFLLYEPVIGRHLFKVFAAEPSAGSQARLRYYRTVMLGIWAPTLIVLLLSVAGAIAPATLGIRWPDLDTSVMGRWPSIVVLVVLAGLCLLILYQLVAARISAAYREKLQSMPVATEVAIMLPHSAPERRVWLLLSLSAGLTEELLYRGFLTYLLVTLFPELSTYLVLLIAALLFGLGHSYQGLAGMFKTSIYGGLLVALYAICGSLLPGILLHFLTDLAAKDVTPAEGDWHKLQSTHVPS